MMLGNPVCFLGYMCVLWKFFSARIRGGFSFSPHELDIGRSPSLTGRWLIGEERLLVDFFGDEYLEYRAATPTLIPLIR